MVPGRGLWKATSLEPSLLSMRNQHTHTRHESDRRTPSTVGTRSTPKTNVQIGGEGTTRFLSIYRLRPVRPLGRHKLLPRPWRTSSCSRAAGMHDAPSVLQDSGVVALDSHCSGVMIEESAIANVWSRSTLVPKALLTRDPWARTASLRSCHSFSHLESYEGFYSFVPTAIDTRAGSRALQSACASIATAGSVRTHGAPPRRGFPTPRRKIRPPVSAGSWEDMAGGGCDLLCGGRIVLPVEGWWFWEEHPR